MTNHEFMKSAQKKLESVWAKLEKKYNVKHKLPALSFNLRGRCAGLAVHGYGHGEIRLNLGYVAKDGESMLNQTVPHEAVHMWLYAVKDPSHYRDFATSQADAYARVMGLRRRRTKRDPHGSTFMSLLNFLGCEERRTHNYDTANAGGHRRWSYKCSRCGKLFQLSTTLHNKIRRGQHRWHTQCGSASKLERSY